MGMSKHNTSVVIVCALLCFPFAANGEDEAGKPRIAIGPVAGAYSEYDVTLTLGFGGGEGEQKQVFALTSYRLPVTGQ